MGQPTLHPYALHAADRRLGAPELEEIIRLAGQELMRHAARMAEDHSEVPYEDVLAAVLHDAALYLRDWEDTASEGATTIVGLLRDGAGEELLGRREHRLVGETADA
ncbi:MAG: hypothetical protein ACRDVM_00810 [Acidimicrobiia bacterium]